MSTMAPAKPAPGSTNAEDSAPRAAPRCRARIPVEVHYAGRVEHAAIADVSATGARIVGLALALEPGTLLEIRYAAVRGVAPKPFRAEFVRATDDGFAIRIVSD